MRRIFADRILTPAEVQERHRNKHPERVRERSRKSMENRRANEAEYMRSYMRRYIYGLEPEAYEAMLSKQGGLCACCERPMVKPQVDHDHQTGVIRGLLCSRCNVSMGGLGDSAASVMRAINYLDPVPEMTVPC